MPHEPEHMNENIQKSSGYNLKSSGEFYNGKVIKFGDYLYTTKSGFYEGHHSQQLVLSDGSTPTDNPPNLNKDVVTTFVVGDASVFGQGIYYYQSNGNRVPVNTPLHHHSHPAAGNTSFMTQHSMTGTETSLNVVTTPGGANRTRVTRVNTTRTTRPSTTRVVRNTGGRTGGSGY